MSLVHEYVQEVMPVMQQKSAWTAETCLKGGASHVTLSPEDLLVVDVVDVGHRQFVCLHEALARGGAQQEVVERIVEDGEENQAVEEEREAAVDRDSIFPFQIGDG
jgi:hypothetical protein